MDTHNTQEGCCGACWQHKPWGSCGNKSCPCHSPVPRESWRERFDEKLRKIFRIALGNKSPIEDAFVQPILDDIHSLLRAEREKTIGEETAQNKEWFDKGVAQEREKVVQMVEGMKIPVQNDRAKAWDVGYNEALSDLKKKLTTNS